MHASVLRHLTFNTYGTLCSHIAEITSSNFPSRSIPVVTNTFIGLNALQIVWEFWYGLLEVFDPQGSSDPSACEESCVLSTVV